jgi:hypothetical protein
MRQFTGTRDNNGTEIYEGDIVAHNGKPVSYIRIKKATGGREL